MILNARDSEVLKAWNAELIGRVALKRLVSKDERNGRFEAFCEELHANASKVDVVAATGKEDEPPGLALEGLDVVWHAIPYGPELPPFLEALSLISRLPVDGPSEAAAASRGSAWLKVFVAPSCPFCPNAVRELIPLFVKGSVRCSIIDAQLFPEMAASHGIKSVPIAILNGAYRWTGETLASDVMAILEDPALILSSPEALERMIKEGQAGNVARMILEKNETPSTFLDLLRHPEWSVRLGALVVMEEIADANMALARVALDQLWGSFADQDAAVRGDIAYLIGELGAGDSAAWTARLEALPIGADEQLDDIVEEAISKLRSLSQDGPV